mmetsp:Transcript_59067/g.156865  ORF Transcript_59067/g.156865 Transcript_59067/m.156865 type:complete len:659 (+) Transcript_59067:318-2294(+)
MEQRYRPFVADYLEYDGSRYVVQDPRNSKLSRWMSRAKENSQTSERNGENASSEKRPNNIQEPVQQESKSKLSRWINRSKKPEEASPAPPSQNKLSRWLSRAQGPSCSPSVTPPVRRARDWSDVDTSASFQDQVDQLTNRVREALVSIDSALKLKSSESRAVLVDDGSGDSGNDDGSGQTMTGLRCPGCGVNLSAVVGDSLVLSTPPEPTTPEGARFRGLGLRVEESFKGLVVTHVVPDGLAGVAGFMVNDVVQSVDGRAVRSLRALGDSLREGTEAGRLAVEVVRGSGAAKRVVSLTVLGGDGSGGDRDPSAESQAAPGADGSADGLLQTFLRARRNERAAEGHPGKGGEGKGGKELSPVPGGRKTTAKFNRYGKDTKLWIPESEAAVGEVGPGRPSASDPARGRLAEIGGFYFFPPGHPDYVPLPPGEAALIAGRQDVHPQERLAPHWSHVVFQSPSGAEIRAQARHATYGSIEAVKGKLVPADPLIAHQDLNNAAEVAGCIVYVKRGGAPFTKKARVAVAAGAIACIVANQDRETFGMSYTDDGLPFAALNIPCVMISSDIAEKLEASTEWRVTLTPVKPEHQGQRQAWGAFACIVSWQILYLLIHLLLSCALFYVSHVFHVHPCMCLWRTVKSELCPPEMDYCVLPPRIPARGH